MAHIFLSYHTQHQITVVKLRDALKSRGFTTWFGEDNKERVPHGEMEKRIGNASVVIMCMSSPYMTSENCKKEIECAERLKKPIIPIRVEYGFEPSGWLEHASGSKTVIDFSDQKKFNESLEQLLKELAAKKISIKKKTGEMTHIFLSYHNQHQKTVMRLCSGLKSRRFTTWFDRDDTVGVLHEDMNEGIENASVVITCMSAPYKTSENCKKEIEYAQRLKKPIIPIRVEYGFEPSGWLQLASGSKMVIDFSDQQNFNKKFEQLLEELAAKKFKPNAKVGIKKHRGKKDDEQGDDDKKVSGGKKHNKKLVKTAKKTKKKKADNGGDSSNDESEGEDPEEDDDSGSEDEAKKGDEDYSGRKEEDDEGHKGNDNDCDHDHPLSPVSDYSTHDHSPSAHHIEVPPLPVFQDHFNQPHANHGHFNQSFDFQDNFNQPCGFQDWQC